MHVCDSRWNSTPGGGHTWPFGGGGNNRRKYALLVLEFFRENPLPIPPTHELEGWATAAASGANWSVAAVPPASLQTVHQ
eukprot:COSAG05_NODE_9582_length_614_cov_1.056311_1_plen_79_part_10